MAQPPGLNSPAKTGCYNPYAQHFKSILSADEIVEPLHETTVQPGSSFVDAAVGGELARP